MKKLSLYLLAALAGTLATAQAQMIGVHYGTTNAAYPQLAATASAGAPGYTQINFNKVVTASATALQDSSGTATTLAATLSGTGLTFSGFRGDPAGNDEILNNGPATSSTNPLTLSLSGIPYASYSLVVYSLDLAGNKPSSFTLGTTTYYANGPSNAGVAGYVDGNAATAYTYIQATGTTAATATANADYEVFTGLSGTTQTLTIQDAAGRFGNLPTIQAFQIINTGVVLEPSTWALLGLGVGGLGLTLRQRRLRSA